MNWVRRRLQEGQLALMLLTRLPAGNLGLNVPKLASAVWVSKSRPDMQCRRSEPKLV